MGGYPMHLYIRQKHIPALWILLQVFFTQVFPGGGDHQLVELFSYKSTRSHMRHGNFYFFQKFTSFWIPTIYTKATIICDPQHTFLINGHPIRAAHTVRNFDGRPIYFNVSGNLIETVALDFSSRGVNVVKRPVISCPGAPVGNGYLWNFLGHSPVSIYTIQA